MTLRRCASICVLFCVAYAVPAASQEAPRTGTMSATVMGYLWTHDDRPIADAEVRLRDVAGIGRVRSTRTVSGGEFLFVAVPPGRYVLEYVRPAPESALVVGAPFTLAAGGTVATFLRVGAPTLLPATSRISISAGPGWTRDLTADNTLMPGATAEVALPIGPGRWVVIEGAWYRQSYQTSVQDANVRRWGISVAGRLGSVSHRGVFGQIGAGVSMQDMTSTGASRYRGQFSSGLDGSLRFTLTPGVGVDIGLGSRVSWRSQGELQVMFQTPRDRWFNPQFKSGLAVTLGPQ